MCQIFCPNFVIKYNCLVVKYKLSVNYFSSWHRVFFFQFLLIFRKADQGELEIEGLNKIAKLSDIDVSVEGVGGAKDFFEAKVRMLNFMFLDVAR